MFILYIISYTIMVLVAKLAVYVSNRVPEIVIGDPGRFRQIITNLVGNSIKVSDNSWNSLFCFLFGLVHCN